MTVTVTVLTFISAILLVLYCFVQQDGGKTPPGPLGLPVLGYLPFLGSKPHQALQRLAEEYGPIFSIRLKKQHIIVINDPEIVKKALLLKTEKEVSEYEASKMSFWINCNLRLQLPWCLDYLKIKIKSHLSEYGQNESGEFSKIASKHDCLANFENYIISRTKNKNSMRLKIGEKRKYDSLIDIFQDKPLSIKIKTEEKTGHESLIPISLKIIHHLSVGSGIQLSSNIKMIETLINFVVDHQQRKWDYNMVYGFVFLLITSIEDSRPLLRNVTAQKFLWKLYDMNCHLQKNIVEWLLLMMASHSEIQKKVQEEIGAAKLPWLSNRYFPTNHLDAICLHTQKSLPYVEAVILELLRWRSPEPLTFISEVGDNAVLEKYFIPNNSILIANIWTIHHNSKYWGDNTEIYQPERFIATNEDTKNYLFPLLVDRGRISRRCLSDVFLKFVTILHRFNVSLPSGKSPDMEEQLHFGLQPKKQDLILTLRN
ncbi:cytochrome P450 18a1 [Trichonephila clavata]|uniref:Cytochrome P450 18a1 n=1 Tax=Trichonephila clavata TaxID=2740835 RepID=A0A8X6KE26_TRICU|nr:cytochrome P450 18a1 [Trichonephila clavata]